MSSNREEQLSQLNEQAAMLYTNLTEFDKLLGDVCIQYKSIQDLAIMQGSLFMASHTVFGNSYNAPDSTTD